MHSAFFRTRHTRHRAGVLAALMLAALMLGSACGSGSDTQRRFSRDIVGYFNTVISLIGYCDTEAEFETYAGQAEQRFRELHQAFDIHQAYDGVGNLYAVNRAAGGPDPVAVTPDVLNLLTLCRDWQAQYGDKVDVTAGALFALWSEYRDQGRAEPDTATLPSAAQLQERASLRGWEHVRLDEENGTVQILLSGLRLD